MRVSVRLNGEQTERRKRLLAEDPDSAHEVDLDQLQFTEHLIRIMESKGLRVDAVDLEGEEDGKAVYYYTMYGEPRTRPEGS